jgi:hypothetical protein
MNMNPFLSKAKAFIVVLEEHAVLRPSVRNILDSQYFAKGDLGAADPKSTRLNSSHGH